MAVDDKESLSYHFLVSESSELVQLSQDTISVEL